MGFHVGVAGAPEAGGVQQRGHVLVAVGHVAVGVPRVGHAYRHIQTADGFRLPCEAHQQRVVVVEFDQFVTVVHVFMVTVCM